MTEGEIDFQTMLKRLTDVLDRALERGDISPEDHDDMMLEMSAWATERLEKKQ